MKKVIVSLFLLCSHMLFSMQNESTLQQPLKFYEDQADYQQLAATMDTYAEVLIDGNVSGIPREYFDLKKQLVPFFKKTYPCITIEGAQEVVSNEEKLKEDVRRLERQTEVLQDYDPQKFEGIKKVSASICEENANEVKIKYLLRQEGAFTEYVVVHTLPDGLKATCLAIGQGSWSIYIGDHKGSIHIYDPIARKETNVLKQHKDSIQALAFFNQGAYIASKDDSRTYVWHVSDVVPRVALKDEPHRTTYLYDQVIVRSHVGQGMLGSYVRNADQVYKLPGSWLNPSLFSADNAKLAFLYLVYKLYFGYDEHPSETSDHLYRAPVLETFEPGVTAAFRRFIEAKTRVALPNKFSIQ